ncbi:hypothetical protein AAEX63_02005 [Luteococcus sp. H138]|uniref:hypothetical protein n=1 Tax=Luteococcus sp. H138 TaxID=3139404 RepID=UPI00313CA1E9
MLDQADQRQRDGLLDLGNVAGGVGAHADGAGELGGNSEQRHRTAVGAIHRLTGKGLAGHHQTAGEGCDDMFHVCSLGLLRAPKWSGHEKDPSLTAASAARTQILPRTCFE